MSQEISLWSLIQSNDFQIACERADQEFASSGNLLALRNKWYALLHLKQYFAAIALGERLIELTNGDTESDFKCLGVANWVAGNTEKATDVWRRSKDCIYKDASGGIEIYLLLYFSGVKTGDEKLKAASIKNIKRLFKSKRAINWPGPLAHHVLNEITEGELLAYVATTPVLKERQMCQVDFVVGIKRLERDDTGGYYKKLEDCVNYGAPSYLEKMYYLAKGELERVYLKNNTED